MNDQSEQQTFTRFAKFFEQKRGETRKQRKTIKEQLKDGPRTITELESPTEMPRNLLLWNLLGMMRWGDVEVTDEREHELVYALKS